MNFKVGQVFNINGNELCLLELINYGNDLYGLFSMEDKKFSYIFYQIVDTGSNYQLISVVDDDMNNMLMTIYEEMNANEV